MNITSPVLRKLIDEQTETQKLDPLTLALAHEVLGQRELIETIATKKPARARWSSDKPSSGWWFQRWKSEPEHRWFIVEVIDGIVHGPGLVTGEIERAQLNGAAWLGPIELPQPRSTKGNS